MKRQPLVSIVITTKNEEKNISNCLESIRKQSYPQKKIETIVVDNNSSDKTKIICGKFTKKIYNSGPERSAQRNFGVKKSQGRYLLYLDADMTLPPRLIEQAVNKLENNRLAALYIPEIISGSSYWTKVRRFERGFYNGSVIDAVRFIRKDVFIKSGGFDENLTGPEDWDLDKKIRRLGRVAVLDKPQEVIYHHEKNFSPANYLKKKNYYAKSFHKYLKKWGRNDPDVKKQFGIAYRYFVVFIEKGGWKKLIKNPFLTLSLFFLRFRVGLIYLKNIFKNYLKNSEK